MSTLNGTATNVVYQVVNVSDGGGASNLLINPRGKINQAKETAGVLTAGQYFCDGWKAGDAGAEVYIDADGFRLISGSIVQLVPNSLDAGRKIRGNMDVINGAPEIRINGVLGTATSDAAQYIRFEVSGNNSKFTRLVLAESETPPVYQQSGDELTPCHRFLLRYDLNGNIYGTRDTASDSHLNITFGEMHSIPAVTTGGMVGTTQVYRVSKSRLSFIARFEYASVLNYIMLDARP
ncbi:hypothetical protein ABF162_07460 [Vibrio coralliilyticus]|uniref:hypothetical protein n=1 Tax=Vibrio coralliilyticus TaxID=190893 RepID=UPI00345E5B78